MCYRAGAFAVGGQVLVQEVAVGLAANLEPHGVIVVLLDFSNLDVAHHLTVVHHGKATGPAVVIHSRLGNAFRATDNRSRGPAILIHFLVARITEGTAVLGHEGDLLFKFVGCPDVIAVEEGDPPALCLAEGAVSAVGGTTITVVFEVVDFRREILRLRLRSAQDDILHDFVGVVGAGVVNDNQFPVGVCLRHHGAYGLRDIRGRVVAGHDNRHQGRHSI